MTEPARIPLWRRDGSIADWALVDQADFEWLSESRWHLRTNGYAAHYPRGGKGRQERMARLLLGLELGDPRHGDHIDRNRLNNQRANLRIVTGHAQNGQNRGSAGGTSQHRGVSWAKDRGNRTGYWLASAKLNGRKYHLGTFAVEADAAAAAAKWRRENMPYSPEAMAG